MEDQKAEIIQTSHPDGRIDVEIRVPVLTTQSQPQ
jgi:hypothetical protein